MSGLTLLIVLGFATLAAVAFAQSGRAAPTHPFGIRDLVAMDRLSDHQVSPEGTRVVFVVRQTDLDANKGRTSLWLVSVDGSGLRRLTNQPESDSQPRWSPDGRRVYFLSARGGSSQVWAIDPEGGEAVEVTHQPLDVGAFTVSPDGSRLAISMDVFPDLPNPKDTKQRLDERAEQKSTGRLYEQAMMRHWDAWKDGRRSHVFVVPLPAHSAATGDFRTRSASQRVTSGERASSAKIPVAGDSASPGDAASENAGASAEYAVPLDLMSGLDADCPAKPFGGAEDFTFTPDGKSLVFAAKLVGREEAWSTDFDLYVVPIDASQPPRCLTESNPAWDTRPTFSPDGKTLAWLAMRVPGYEADRFRVMLMSWPDGKARCLTEAWDRSPGEFSWSPDSRALYAAVDHLGQIALFAIDATSGEARIVVKEGHVRGPVGASAGGPIVFGMDQLQSPVDLYTLRPDGSDLRRITRFNESRLAAVRLGEPEQFTFKGWNNETVHAYVVKPVDFDPSQKYPVAFLIHGGPQGSFGNDFHYRWNPQSYAGAGYAAIMVDFHGSTGYGQAFCDAIQNDWGGKPLVDLQKGLEAALAKYPWMDGSRVAALGASYGGYMINWIAGNWPDRFRCLVNHDGVFDTRMGYFDTEELWFPEREHGGAPWDRPEAFEEHNPARFVGRWKTPMLVIHGANDFRVCETHGLAAFNACQRRGTPSKLLHFPDENHWVLKPHNSILWHDTVLGWLDQWCK
ncbi:MAG: S9 family peptidase [Phycisphaerales bacterium]|nr:S9 family peptidase [Phycisphaerales bacterium]